MYLQRCEATVSQFTLFTVYSTRILGETLAPHAGDTTNMLYVQEAVRPAALHFVKNI